MKIRPRIRDIESFEDARRLLDAGANDEMVLLFLRDRGFDQADCTYALQDLTARAFSDAKDFVIRSKAWSDRYERDSELRKALREALRILSLSDSQDQIRIEIEDRETRND